MQEKTYFNNFHFDLNQLYFHTQTKKWKSSPTNMPNKQIYF